MHTEATSDPSRKCRSSSEGPFPVRLRLLGGFNVWVGSHAVAEGAWHLRKAKSLVKLLALASGHALHREQIMDLLWPELGKRAASNNLRVSLHGARKALAADSILASHYLASKEERVVLCPEVELWVDVEAIEEAANAARRSRDPGAYRAALELYGGELLPEDRYEQWAEGRRGELLRLYLALLVELAGLYLEHGDQYSAVATLREALAEEPTNEEAHVGLMRLYALSGQSREALRQYEQLTEALSGELGAEPSASTRALSEEIATGRFPAAPTQPAGAVMEGTAGGGGVGKHNLPAQRTAFVGREREMLEVKRALAMTHLFTLTGVGGSGKTRLALEVGRDLVGAYPDGVWLVELAPLSEGKLVAQAVADVLGVPEGPGRSLADAIVEALREKRLLLVLDNCEHLVDAAARLTDTLLSSCPGLRIVATSREALGVEGELVWQVAPLSFPVAHRDGGRDAHRAPAAEELARYDAVRLFVERARLRSPHFELRAENAGAVAQICRRLEGMPLAIELAAARVRALPVELISERLEDSLKLLSGESRAAAPRQRTLRATLDWSHNLLPAEERAFLRRLSAFAGGWTVEAAEAVGTGDGIQEEDVLELLSKLVDKSLVVAEVRAGEVRRYRLLEPVRQYARERLEESGEDDAFRRRHAAFFLALAEETEPALVGAQQQESTERLEEEHDNLRAALSWLLEKEPESALRLVGALARFWEMRARFVEGSAWLEAALRQSDRADAAKRAKALSEAGTFAWHQGDYDRALVLHGEALALYQEVGNDSGVAFAQLCLGTQHLEKGDHEHAAPFYEATLALSRSIEDRRNVAYALRGLAEVARRRDEYERAKALGMECVALAREMEDQWELGRYLGWVGMLTVWSGNDHSSAARFLKEALSLLRQIGDWDYAAYCLEGFAGLAGARAQGVRAARLWGATESLRSTIGAPPTPEARRYYDRSMAAARALLEEAAWDTAFAEGQAMSAEEAIEYALSAEEHSPAAPRAPKQSSTGAREPDLTRREKEVAALVAQGLTSRQIAKELVLSERTVENHVANILKKLELHSRDQVAPRIAKQ